MKEYEKPVMEIIEINTDIITQSCDTEMPFECAWGDEG